MKLAEELKRIAALEALAVETAQRIARQGSKRTDLAPVELATLTEAFGDAARAEAFLDQMPAKPGAKAILAAFSNPAELQTLVEGTLGGDMRALAVLAERGCKRDPALLKTFATTMAGNADFKTVFTKGGLAERPEALAALLEGGCDGDAAKLATLCTTFKDPNDAAKLAGALGEGGLGQTPEALGALAKGDNGATLKKLADSFVTSEDRGKLNDLLTRGGFDGKAPGRPGLLADVVRKGLGDTPARLKDLHAAFSPGANDAGFDLLGTMLTGLDGADGKAGERLKLAMAGFVQRNGVNAADAAKKMRDPFMTKIDKMGRAGGAPDPVSDTAGPSAAAATKVPLPAVETVSLDLGALVGPGGGQPLDARAMALTLGPQAAALAQVGGRLEGVATGIGKLPLATPADPAFTEETRKQTLALSKAKDADLVPPGGPDLKDITALETLSSTLLDRLPDEADSIARSEAIAAIKLATAAIGTALARLAAAKLASTGAAGAAAAEVTGVLALRPGAGVAEKAALKDIGQSAMVAAAAAAAATADPSKTALTAGQAIKTLDPSAQSAATDAANKKAEAAAAAARAAATEVAKAAAPVDPALIARTAALAAAAAEAGTAAPDVSKATAAFAAAKLAADAAAAAARRAAAGSRLAAAMDSTEAKKGFAAAGSCDLAAANLTAAGKGPEAAALTAVAEAARSGAISLHTAEEALKVDKSKATQDAKDRIARREPDPLKRAGAETAANTAAKLAGEAASLAALKLPLPTLTSAPDYKTWLADAEAKAQAALRLAPLAVDQAIRDLALSQARDALQQVAAAAKRFAADALATAQTELTTKQTAASQDNTVKRRAFMVNHTTGPKNLSASALAGTVETARGAVSQVAKGVLSGLYANDPTVSAARDTALVAEATASVPGAPRADKVKALLERCKAEKAAAEAAFAAATTAVGKIGPVPGNANVNNLTANTGTSGMPAPAAFRDALARVEAASTAAAKWRESALAALAAATQHEAELTALPAKSQAETDDLQNVQNCKTLAEGQRDAAVDQQKKLSPDSDVLHDLNDLVMRWANWVNTNNHDGSAGGGDIVASYGLATMQESDGARNGGTFTAMPREALIRNAASLQANVYDATAPTDQELALPSTHLMRKKHISGRHCRENYEYGNQEDGGPTPEQFAAGKMVAAAVKGKGTPLTGVAKSLRDIGRAAEKVNSLLPEEVVAANLDTVIQLALDKALASLVSPITLVTKTPNPLPGPPNPSFWQFDAEITIPPKTEKDKVKIGIKRRGALPVADMMHGDTTNTMTMPDMIAMGRAIGK